jgi:DNA polymerase-3 subunit gamma/tau
VGQEHVVRTLTNALEQGKVHHAYLFVGSRGTGKTSMAKILAAALNCVNGPTTLPCGTCESCVSIASATSLDVVEMDAASNNSVDDIRDLREKVAFAPVSGRSKIYILDEAHMLSTAAWNAFLKTLEEPPPHTIFVLATTEANKVLPTVVDRCHRFDFGRPTVTQIASVLRRVADSESIAIGDDALALVARNATGSFRDALGTLEQLVAYSGAEISLDDVLAVLGVADADLVFGAVDAVASGQAGEALRAAARLAESGRDVGRFFGDLEAHARALMIVQAIGSVPAELQITPEQDSRLAEQAARVSPTDVIRLLDLLAIGMRAMKDGSEARTQLELALTKAASPQHDPSTKALLARIERLEAARAAAPAQSSPPAPAPAAAPPAPAPAPPAPAPAAAPPAPVHGDAPVASPPTPPPAPTQTAPPAPAPVAADHDGEPSADDWVSFSSPPEDEPAPFAPAAYGAPPSAHATQPPTPRDPAVSQTAVAREAAPAEPEPSNSSATAVEVSAPQGGDADLAHIREVWPAVVEHLQAGAPVLSSALNEARPTTLQGGTLTLAWPHSGAFFKRKAEDPACRAKLADAIRIVTGTALGLAFELRDDEELAAAPPVGVQLSEEEVLARFVTEFDAEELPPEPAPTEES